MILIRVFEDSLEALCRSGEIAGGVHIAAGQEAVAVGAIRALRPTDVVTSSHRPHHHAIAKGISLHALMAELFGTPAGCCGGRGGTMHVADFSIGYLGANGIVGAAPGIAMGASLASRIRGDDRVALAFTGDGALNTGRLWETINLAAVWRLPLIIVCENNLYASQTLSAHTTASPSVAERVSAFGMRAVHIDGQDVGAVFREAQHACSRARSGVGPTFIDAATYRYYGHVSLEIVDYRSGEEVAAQRGPNDPIQRLAHALTRAGSVDDVSVNQMVEQAKTDVADAIAFARSTATTNPNDYLSVGRQGEAPEHD
jgi:pyruvate dehydrogenase E1 component alpha subunit